MPATPQRTAVSRLRKAVVAVATLVAATIGLASSTASPASASAIGCSAFSTGALCHELYGSGRTINAQNVTWNSVSSLCNWRVDFVYINTSGVIWFRDVGPTHGSCDRNGTRYRGPGYAQYGLACAYLYKNNGTYVARQCHNITP